MVVFRVFAWILLLIAMVALVGDFTRAANGGAFAMTTTFGYWKGVSPQSLAASAAYVQRSLHPWLWDALAMRVLLLPIWFLLGSLGLVLAIVGRKKRRVNIFAN